MSQPDPFLQVQEEVLSTLSSLRSLSSSHNRIRSLAKTTDNEELQQARNELETTLGDLESDLEDLSESVRAIEHDPYRYGIELDELERRRQLVVSIREEVQQIKDDLQRQDSQAEESERRRRKGNGEAGLPSPSQFEDMESAEGAGGQNYYEEMEQQTQMEMFAEQDQQLDGVFRTVGNLRAQAGDMGRELEEQAGIIEDVDRMADRVGGKLKNGVRRIGHVIKKNEDTASSFCIGLLIFVLILLLILLAVL